METAIRASRSESQAEEWALVLASAGIPHRVEPYGPSWTLLVPDEDVARARATLYPFDEETRTVSVVTVTPAIYRPTPWWIGILACLALLTFFAVTGLPGRRAAWLERGASVAGRALAEPWRAVTSLTLHLDAAHVASNALAIAVLLPAVGQRFGAGVGLALVVLAGAAGNAFAAVVHAPGHSAVGASTAVFSALGILGAARLFPSAGEPRGRAKRWTVLAASLVLFAILGTSQRSDVLAHATGFVSGAITGAIASAAVRRPYPPPAQWLVGVLTVLLVVGCWLPAMR